MKYLFKGKRANNGEWVEGSFLDGSHMHEKYALICPKMTVSTRDEDGITCGDFTFVDPKTVGIWTGLEDENETKIFEGDIVKASNGVRHFFMLTSYNSLEARFEFDDSCGRITLVSDWTRFCSLEVIGNIHDKKWLKWKDERATDD